MTFAREVEIESGVVCPPPWEIAPYGVVSLLEMLRLYADRFAQYFSTIQKCETQLKTMALFKETEIVAPNIASSVLSRVVALALVCGEHDLASSYQKCERIIEKMAELQNRVTSGEMYHWLTDLRERCEDDLKGELFLHLSLTEARLYNSPKEEWGHSISKFHQTIGDIEEAAKCLALARYTGAVFHLQRVMEFGLKSLAVKLGKPFDKNSWDSHLKDIERELEARYKAAGSRTPDEEFYSEAAAQIGHIKVAWRNPTMHIDRTYTPEVARDIWNAVKAFMRHLATRVP
jgi:HEPN domain-containing protein